MKFSVIEFTSVAAYIVIFAFLWRSLAAWLVKRDDGTTSAEFGKAMGFLL